MSQLLVVSNYRHNLSVRSAISRRSYILMSEIKIVELNHPCSPAEVLRLLRAFRRLTDASLRERTIAFVESLAAKQTD